MYAKSKAFRNLVIVLVVLILLGAGLLLLKNLGAQGVLGSGSQADGSGAVTYEDSSGMDASAGESASTYELADPGSGNESTE